MNIQDEIGTAIKALVAVEEKITHLAFLNEGITQPEIVAAHHQELRELRNEREALRTQLSKLKTEHKRELVQRLSGINRQLDTAHLGTKEVELRHDSRELEKAIGKIEEEIKTYQS